MDKYVFMEQNNNILKCRIVFPVKGKLKFELLGSKSTEFVWKVPFKSFSFVSNTNELNVLARKIVNLNGNLKFFFGSGCVNGNFKFFFGSGCVTTL